MEHGRKSKPKFEEDEEVGRGGEKRDQIIDAIGNMGRWQITYILFLFLTKIPAAWPSLSITFFSAKTDYWCERPPQELGQSVDDWRNFSSPLITIGDAEVRDQCHVWNTSDFRKPADNTLQSCQAWEYDRAFYNQTIIQEFNLVCENRHKKNLAQSVYFGGLMFGVFMAGWSSDHFGRKKTLIPLYLGMATFGVLTAFMPNIDWFIASRFFHGMFGIVVATIIFCWCMECVGGKWQTLVGIGFEGPWVIGWFLLALIAYLAPDWRQIQLITSVPVFLSLCAFWILPESPKWLLAVGRIDEAEEIVRKAADMNGRVLPPNWRLKQVQDDSSGKKKATVFDLLSRKHMALKTLIMYLNWFTNSFVYYGLSLNSGSLAGSTMTNFLLNGAMEIPAYIFSTWILLKKGRKMPYVALMLLGGIALFCTMAVPKNAFPHNWPAVVLSLIGKLCITGKKSSTYVTS